MTTTWRISFFNRKVELQALSLPAGIHANLLHTLELIKVYGPAVGMPYTRKLERGLFEIRARGREGIGRCIFCDAGGRELVILCCFAKKSAKTPLRELQLARKRMKEI